MPKVTVWLSSYNHDKFLAESIESILCQTYEDFELFIIDDCSDDTSWSIIQKYSLLDKRIKAFRHSVNQGKSGMANMLEQLQGEYVAIAHCDDKWEKEKLEKQIQILDSHPEIAACFTLAKIIDDSGDELKNETHPYYKIFAQPNRSRQEWLHWFFYNGNCLCHPSLLIRKEAYEKYGLFTTGLHGYPDFCKWIRLCKNAEIYILQEKLTNFRVHNDESNTSGSNEKSLKRLSIEEYFVLEEFVDLIKTKQLLSVFPELGKYKVNGDIEEYFALAKLMMSVPRSSYYLMGLRIIYEILKDKNRAQKLEKLYGYTSRMYNLDKQKTDVFHVIPEERNMKSSIRFGVGEEEENIYSCPAFLQNDGSFRIKIASDKVNRGGKIRFIPDEGRFRKFASLRVFEQGEEVECIALNGKKLGDDDYFFTLHPEYEICIRGNKELIIQGNSQLIPLNMIEDFACRYNVLEEENVRLRDELGRILDSKGWKLYLAIKKVYKKVKRN